MVRLLALLIALVGLAVLAQMTGLLDFDTRGTVRAPAIDVKVSGGELPEVDVETAKVKVGVTEKTMKLPSGVDVDMQKEQVKLPEVKVDETTDDGSTAK
jgi:hypothetical protein